MNKIEIFPTMITPFNKDGSVDYEGVKKLVEFYDDNNCDGIFATCQSSEIFFLSLEERINITKTVMDTANEIAARKNKKRMTIVASGHVSDSFDMQVKELTEIAKTGVDSVILISNRLDIENTSDDKWIEDLYKLIDKLPSNINLGVYECPRPYKRLLTAKMIDGMLKTNRFTFIKDTCCDADMIKERVEQIKGTKLKLLNANAQTFLETARDGANGYCGVMANFHPNVYRVLADDINGKNSDLYQSFICLAAFTECLAYPASAKYYLKEYKGIDITPISRSVDCNNITNYQKSCLKQMKYLEDQILQTINK